MSHSIAPPPLSASASPRSNLPSQPTSFIGREAELVEIRQLMLEEADCRLLTLVGPGGIGKTRLALAAAEQVGEAFPDGVYFIGLASVSEPEFIVSAIAEGLRFNFSGGQEPKDQLLSYLRQKRLLLVVDNFEHLREGADLLSEILSTTPQVTLLVTSREVLNLQDEWLYPVGGLPVPPPTQPAVPGEVRAETRGAEEVEAYGAVRLFLQSARHADASFRPSPEDIRHVVRICQLVAGMPLGLELAASWVRPMTCQEIAQEIERNFDFLTSSRRDIPERHRSLKAVFEQTWQRLSAEEQAVLSKLSVFRGGCLREAAAQVTGATLSHLSSLVDKTLLRRTSSGRYDMHELIRQFAAEQLQSTPDDYEQVQDQHCAYYTSFLERRTAGIKGGRQKETLEEITADIDNVRLAWRRALADKDAGAVEKSAECLFCYYNYRNAFLEGEAAFRQAAATFTVGSEGRADDGSPRDPVVLVQQENLVGYLLAGQGFLCARGRDPQEGQTLLEGAVALLRRAGPRDRRKEGFALVWLGYALHFQGRHTEARQYAETSLALFSEIGEDWGMTWCLLLLGTCIRLLGHLTEADQVYKRGLTLCREIGERPRLAYISNNLGRMAIELGQYDQAKQYIDEGASIFRELGNSLGLAVSLDHLGQLLLAQGEYRRASQTLQQSVAYYHEVGSTWAVRSVQINLGTAFRLQGDHSQAEQLYHQSLEAQKAANNQWLMGYCLRGLGCLAYERGELRRAEQFLQEALALAKQMEHQPDMAAALGRLGQVMVAWGEGRETEAGQYFQRALDLATRHELAPIALDVFVGLARLLAGAGKKQEAVELLVLTEHHPASTYETKEKAGRHLTELTANLPSDVATVAQARGQRLEWQETAEWLSEDLSKPNWGKPQALANNLPTQPTPFIGREQELADIIRRIQDPTCRLLTLVGPGGIGKTRLAIQAAQLVIDESSDPGEFEHGIFFVSLAPVSAHSGIVSAIAEAINFHFYGHLPPRQQLIDHLRQKQMLLILDNFEHVLAGTDLMPEILAAAPGVKIVVTSREALSLQEAWFHPVTGMAFPSSSQAQPASFAGEGTFVGEREEVTADEYDAVRLFVQCARRARVGFSLADEQASVVSLCRLVEGMPLALELAASRLKVLPVEEIVAEIEHGLDILTARQQNVPERHRSMRVVLDQSWQLLSGREREAFKRLSVFRGSFQHEAGSAVAGASLLDLETFVDKSLLQVTPSGRYHMHELLRQYAAEQLAEAPEAVAATYEAHCTYYADFLQGRLEGLMSERQRQALAAIATEYDNVWAAWQWAVKGGQAAEIQRSVMSIYLFWQYQSRYLEGVNALEEACRSLNQTDPTEQVNLALVRVLVFWGWLLIRLGQLDKAEGVLQQCGDLYRHLGIPPVPGNGTDPAAPLGVIALARGDYAAAVRYGQQARQTAERHQHHGNRPVAHYVLASAALDQGDYTTAQQHAQQGYALAQKTDPWFTAYCLNKLGHSVLALGDIDAAQRHYEASYALRKEFNDPEGMALALHHLGKVALRRQDYVRGQHLYGESLAIYQDLNDRGGLARAYKGLGATASAQGDFEAAQQHLYQALRLAAEIDYVPLEFSILNVIGELWLKSGRPEEGLIVLAFVRQHPASDRAAQDEAQRLLDRYRAEVQTEEVAVVETAKDQTERRTLEEVVAEILQGAGEQGGRRAGEKINTLMPPYPHASTLPQQRFVQEALIASGGICAVYQGRDTETGRPVAIKRLKPELVARNPALVKRLIREGEALRQLNHPNIVKILATIEDEGQSLIVMEYAPGGSLGDLLEKQPQLPLDRVLDISLELADALARAHHLGILHRDLKPANVLLAEDGTPRLTDFGAAYLKGRETRLTPAGTILGTASYMSPEAWRGEDLDARSDIWSFGALLYEMLAGRPPFAQQQVAATLTAILNDPLPKLGQFRPDTPPALVELIEQMLVKERAQRISSMRQVAAGLEVIGRSLTARL